MFNDKKCLNREYLQTETTSLQKFLKMSSNFIVIVRPNDSFNPINILRHSCVKSRQWRPTSRTDWYHSYRIVPLISWIDITEWWSRVPWNIEIAPNLIQNLWDRPWQASTILFLELWAHSWVNWMLFFITLVKSRTPSDKYCLRHSSVDISNVFAVWSQSDFWPE